MNEFKVGKSAVGMRADVFVAGLYPDFARSALKNLFERQKVFINDKVAKPGHKLKPGTRLKVDASELNRQPEPSDLPVIYEDKDVVVINKPTGILTHSKGVLNYEPTVASFLRTKIDDSELSGNRAGIVHRLDRATSGIIIGAKNRRALDWLQKQFSSRKVKKTYLAIVEGVPRPKAAIIDAPIGRNPKKPQIFKVIANGKPAQSEYRLIKSIKRDGKDYSLMEIKPITGRTHQIRVHLAYIGHPVVGDAVYGRAGSRMYLHAQTLELTLPNSQSRFFSAPTPKIFKDFLKA